MPTQPNILIIQPDQHRGTIMGCAGDKQVQTPNLDHLAAQGIRFSHAVSASPVCCPFRGTLQTGLYQHTHRVDGNNIRLSPDHTGFALGDLKIRQATSNDLQTICDIYSDIGTWLHTVKNITNQWDPELPKEYAQDWIDTGDMYLKRA